MDDYKGTEELEPWMRGFREFESDFREAFGFSMGLTIIDGCILAVSESQNLDAFDSRVKGCLIQALTEAKRYYIENFREQIKTNDD